MKKIGMFEAKTKLSEICAQVAKDGEEVVITLRGTPYVQITPLERKASTLRERMAEYRVKTPEVIQPDQEFELPPRPRDVFGEPGFSSETETDGDAS